MPTNPFKAKNGIEVVSGNITLPASATVDGIDISSIPSSYAAINQTMYIGTTVVNINRSSSALSLYGVSIDGSAATSTTQLISDSSTNIATTNFVKRHFGSTTTSGTLDWDDTSNLYPGAGQTLLTGSATHGPDGTSDYFHPLNFEYSSKTGVGNITQLAIAYGTPGNKLYMRGRYGGYWGLWVKFLRDIDYTYIGTTQISLSRVSNPVALTGIISIDGSAAKWTTPRTITLDGAVSGSASIDGSANITINTTGSSNSNSIAYAIALG